MIGESLMFTVFHLTAICSVMAGSFIAGFWYANNTYIRGKKIESSIKRHRVIKKRDGQYDLFNDSLPRQVKNAYGVKDD